ncbi:hypothetical protein [Sphingobium boeckii]|uniref:Uncharacterized protein n=1 Tax=Sphingobium boeckii TaxID=1082345 RepID=A0A7W9AES1_9SPHN|nr:hypothetical protein [Sphingobium boeckii]MBB5684323.1 hypothetical protein [Sphingobium boeckii]
MMPGHSFSASKGAAPDFKGLGCGLALFAGVAVAFSQCSSDAPKPSDPAMSAKPPVDRAATEAQFKKCEAAIVEGKKIGLIRQTPSPQRVNVEDRAWALLPADAKKGLALTVGCIANGGLPFSHFDMMDLDSYKSAVVYGYRSGKRLAHAGPWGVTLE